MVICCHLLKSDQQMWGKKGIETELPEKNKGTATRDPREGL